MDAFAGMFRVHSEYFKLPSFTHRGAPKQPYSSNRPHLSGHSQLDCDVCVNVGAVGL